MPNENETVLVKNKAGTTGAHRKKSPDDYSSWLEFWEGGKDFELSKC